MPRRSVDIRYAIRRNLSAACYLLSDLIRFPSLAGNEGDAMEYLARTFRPFADQVEKVAFPPDFTDDEEYSFPQPGLSYQGRHNLKITIEGQEGPGIIFNTHCDVVPPARDQPNPFTPRIEGPLVFGRGACDAKGQIATLYLLARVLRRMKRPRPTVVLHIVVEEEVGGNGTLGMVRKGEKGQAAVVLEPTGGRIVSSVRGAVWFRLLCRGTAGHSGAAGHTASALENCLRAITCLKAYHQELLAKSSGIAFFDRFENPMPLTFGRLHSGTWPAAAPDEALLEGVLGFLPNLDRRTVMEEVRGCLRDAAPSADTFELEFTYRHDCHVLDPGHALVQALQAACRESEQPDTLDALPASCDSWYYNNLLGIPTVVFGPGHLKYAHSANEQISLDEITAATEVLARFVLDS